MLDLNYIEIHNNKLNYNFLIWNQIKFLVLNSIEITGFK